MRRHADRPPAEHARDGEIRHAREQDAEGERDRGREEEREVVLLAAEEVQRPDDEPDAGQVGPECEPAPPAVVERDAGRDDEQRARQHGVVDRGPVVPAAERARRAVHREEAGEQHQRQHQERAPIADEQEDGDRDRRHLHPHPAAGDVGVEIVEVVALEVEPEQPLDAVRGQRRVERHDRREPRLEQAVPAPARPLGRDEEACLPEERQREHDADAERLVAVGRPPGVGTDQQQRAEPRQHLHGAREGGLLAEPRDVARQPPLVRGRRGVQVVVKRSRRGRLDPASGCCAQKGVAVHRVER